MNRVLIFKVLSHSYNSKLTLGSHLHDLQSNITATTHKKKVAVSSVF